MWPLPLYVHVVQFVNVMMMGPIIHLVVRRRINSRIIMCDLAYYENIKLCAQQQERKSFPGNKIIFCHCKYNLIFIASIILISCENILNSNSKFPFILKFLKL